MKVIDYLYYWFFHYYKNKCKYNDIEARVYHKSIHSSASLALSTLLLLLYYCVFMIIGRFIPGLFSFEKIYIIIIALAVCVLTLTCIWKYYKNKISILNDRFGTSLWNKKIKGWMMFLLMYSLFFLPILVGVLFYLLNK